MGTPRTHRRFLNRSDGTYGPIPSRRPAGMLGMPFNRTAVQGLYCVGDSTFPGQGVNAVVFSGFGCAHRWALGFRRGRGLGEAGAAAISGCRGQHGREGACYGSPLLWHGAWCVQALTLNLLLPWRGVLLLAISLPSPSPLGRPLPPARPSFLLLLLLLLPPQPGLMPGSPLC